MEEDKNFLIFKNLLTDNDQQIIKDTLFGLDFPWTFISDITHKKPGLEPRPGFSHIFYEPTGSLKSNFQNIVNKITEEGLKKIKKDKGQVVQARSFLQLPLNKSFETFDDPHVDLDYNHIVFLYYVCDSDGDTILFNQDKNFSKIEKQVTPEQGKLLVFNGKIWHTAQQPKNNIRCVINIDLLI